MVGGRKERRGEGLGLGGFHTRPKNGYTQERLSLDAGKESGAWASDIRIA